MAVTGWKFPTASSQHTASHDSYTAVWASPTNMYADDTSYATNNGDDTDGGVGEKYLFNDFGFAVGDIPAGATIDGIEVEITGSGNSTTNYGTNQEHTLAQQLYANALVGTALEHSTGAIEFGTSLTAHTTGGATSLWGTTSATLDDADIKATTFGIVLWMDGNRGVFDWDQSNTQTIDYVKIRVYYTASGYADLDAVVGAFTETGVAALFYYNKGFAATVGTFTETGVAATFQRGLALDASAAQFLVGGVAAGTLREFTIDCAVGNVSVTGTDTAFQRALHTDPVTATFNLNADAAILSIAKNLYGDVQSYTLTGIAAGLTYDRVVNSTVQTYALTGVTTALDLATDIEMVATTVSFTLTGIAADLLRTFPMDATATSFALTGIDATFSRIIFLDAGAGSFTTAGIDLIFDYTRDLAVDPGAFTYGRESVSFLIDHILTADTGSFALTGIDVIFVNTTGRLDAVTGSFALTGVDVAFDNDFIMDAFGGIFLFSRETTGLTVREATILLGDSSELLYDESSGYLSDESNLGNVVIECVTTSFVLIAPKPRLIQDTMTVDVGAFTLSGGDISFSTISQYQLACAAGSFALTGVSNVMGWDQLLNVSVGSFAATYYDANVWSLFPMEVTGPGVFVMTGKDAAFSTYYNNPPRFAAQSANKGSVGGQAKTRLLSGQSTASLLGGQRRPRLFTEN